MTPPLSSISTTPHTLFIALPTKENKNDDIHINFGVIFND